MYKLLYKTYECWTYNKEEKKYSVYWEEFQRLKDAKDFKAKKEIDLKKENQNLEIRIICQQRYIV